MTCGSGRRLEPVRAAEAASGFDIGLVCDLAWELDTGFAVGFETGFDICPGLARLGGIEALRAAKSDGGRTAPPRRMWPRLAFRINWCEMGVNARACFATGLG